MNQAARFNSFRFFGLALVVVLFGGCHSDVVRVEVAGKTVSAKSDLWEIDLKYPEFSSSDSALNQSLAVLNGRLVRFIADLQDSLKAQARHVSEAFEPDSVDRRVWLYCLTARDSVFLLSPDYVSARLEVYTYTGGAHGATAFYAFNFDVKNQRLLPAAEVIDLTRAAEVNRLLAAGFVNPGSCFTDSPELNRAAAITFTPDSVCFTFEHYVLGPYACGPAWVTLGRTNLGTAFLPKTGD